MHHASREIIVDFPSKNGLQNVEKAIRDSRLKSPQADVLGRKLADLCI